jgi:hypothetical protein
VFSQSQRGSEDAAADCDGAVCSSRELETAPWRDAEIPSRLGYPAAEDGISAEGAAAAGPCGNVDVGILSRPVFGSRV